MQHNFKNLKIWMYAMDLTAEVHQITKLFPKHETYGLISQMNRAAVSVPSNIAEGSNRGNKHFVQFLNCSLGSCFELQTQLLIAHRHEYIDSNLTDILENKLIELQKMISGFITKLEP